MRSGKELILLTKEFAHEKRAISWYILISTTLLLVVTIVANFILTNIFLRIGLSVLTSLLLVRMFMIYHDFEHKAILQKSIIAKWIMTLFGIFILNPASIWKRSHDYHHAHNSKLFSASIGSYPIMTKEKYLKASRSERFWYLFIRNPITVFFAYIITFMLGMCVGSFIASPKRHYDSLIALFIHFSITVLILIFYNFTTLLLVQTIPFFISSFMGAYLFYAQHNFPGVIFKKNIEWSYDNAALQSSSYMVMNPVLQWFTANIGYHHVHHLNARIPFYRLPEAMQKIPELNTASKTSLNPSDIIKCFRLKVWDAENKKMIGFKELKGI